MPKHLAIGENFQSGTVSFNDVKTMTITFAKLFTRRPSVTLTLADVNSTPPYKKKVTKTKLKIKFQSAFNGEVDWMAMENGG